MDFFDFLDIFDGFGGGSSGGSRKRRWVTFFVTLAVLGVITFIVIKSF